MNIEKIKKVKEKLLEEFNWRAANSIVQGAGISKDKNGEYINVYLNRELKESEKQKYPSERDGVRVKYDVIGTIRAH